MGWDFIRVTTGNLKLKIKCTLKRLQQTVEVLFVLYIMHTISEFFRF